MSTQDYEVKLLVVDDEPAFLEEMCEFLSAAGYQCYACQNAEDALACFRQDWQIGLVLCDLHMPGTNGLELIEQLVKIAERERPFQAIIFTGSTDQNEVIQAMRAGVADYFPKPIDQEQLLITITRLSAELKASSSDYERLAQLNDKLHSLTESINELYQHIQSRHPHSEHSEKSTATVQPPAELPEAFKALSPRQLAVARLVGKGLTNYQIACELGITENTVKLYVSQVLRLTHMRNRTQLALALSPSRA
jgi:DNA-binding NarL/FixJ family response regulator